VLPIQLQFQNLHLYSIEYCFPLSVSLEQYRVKREDLDEEDLEKQLCLDKGAGEWFRLETGDDKCRDVIQCTASVTLSTRIYVFKCDYNVTFKQINWAIEIA
jgi:hypothetical protein